MFGMQGKAIAILVVGGGVVYGVSELDKGMNYVETTGVVTSAKVDCFIKSKKFKITKDGSRDLLYMDCKIAPRMAKRHRMRRSDIHGRAKIEYKFNSPVDGKTHIGKFTTKREIAKYKHGAKFTVYAHKTKADKSRL